MNAHHAKAIPIVLIASLVAAGCSYSEYHEDLTAGLNGSFEVVQDGLPVNWYFYTEDTAGGDFDVVVDTDVFVHGEQSVRFDIRDCSDEGGRHSPGLFQEFDAVPGKSYTVSFLARNDGTRFRAGVRGVDPKTGGPFESITDRSDSFSNWQRFEYKFEMPDHDKLRFEISVLGPGVLWIDDIRILD
jgi:hypothetical protein